MIDLGTDPATGKRQQKWTTFKGTKKQAKQERTRLLPERDTGELVADPTKWTLAEYLAHWLDTYVVQNCDIKTETGYRGIVNARIVPLLGKVLLAKLTAAQIREPEDCQRAAGARDRGNHAGHLQPRPAGDAGLGRP